MGRAKLYLLVGVVGFILTPSGGVVLGIFPVNIFHHVFHIALGGLGLVARWAGRGRLYCRIAGVVFLVLGALGLIAPPLMAMLLAHPGAGVIGRAVSLGRFFTSFRMTMRFIDVIG